MLNRDDSTSAAAQALDSAAIGFKAVGEAAWDSDSMDYAMFSPEGNQEVAALVRSVQLDSEGVPEELMYEALARGIAGISVSHPEIFDTMARETLAGALDNEWVRRYGVRIDQWKLSRGGVA